MNEIGEERVFLPRKDDNPLFLVMFWAGMAIWGAYRSLAIAMFGSPVTSDDRFLLMIAGFMALLKMASVFESRFNRFNRLTLSPSGVTVRRGWKTLSVGWSDIETAERIEIRPLEGENYWAVALRPRAQSGGRPKEITLEGFDVDPDELLEIIQDLQLQHARLVSQ